MHAATAHGAEISSPGGPSAGPARAAEPTRANALRGPVCRHVVPWCLLAACVALAILLGPASSSAAAWWVLAGSVLLFGLPHGSADWWVLRLAAGAGQRGRFWTLVAVYVGAIGLTLAFWAWQPALALPGFLALTVWHFGSADASVLLPGSTPLRSLGWWLFALGRGLLVIFAPLAFHPAATTGLLRPFAELNGAGGGTVAFLIHLAPALTILGFGWCLAGASCRWAGEPTRARVRRWLLHAAETLLLTALFWLTPPLLGFTCYFVAFHAWRHVLRLETLTHPHVALSPGRAVLDYHWRTLPVTLLSLIGLALIFWLWPTLWGGRSGWITAYFIFLSALTVPHALVIGWLDAAQPPLPA